MNESIDALIEEIVDTLTEGVHNSRWDLVVCHHEVGKMILAAEKNGVTVTQIADGCGKHRRRIYRCRQLVERYPKLDDLPEGKNISIHKLFNKYLPKEKREKPTLEEKIAEFLSSIQPEQYIPDRRKDDWEVKFTKLILAYEESK